MTTLSYFQRKNQPFIGAWTADSGQTLPDPQLWERRFTQPIGAYHGPELRRIFEALKRDGYMIMKLRPS